MDEPQDFLLTRRGLLVAGAATAAGPLPPAEAAGAQRPGTAQPAGTTMAAGTPAPVDVPTAAAPPVPSTAHVTLEVNGVRHTLALDTRTTLLDALREHLRLTGSKKGCDQGQCGACTVLVDGRRVVSCLSLAVMAEGAKVTTIEGLGMPQHPHALQAAFVKHDGFQCGYCTPGQVCSAVGMLDELRRGVPSHAAADIAARPLLSADELRERMSGNICRCGAYSNIAEAIAEVAGGGA